MKICMFTNTYLPHVGGVARSVSTFAEELRRNSHDVLIVAPTFPNQEDEGEDRVIRVPAIQNFNGSDFSVRIPLPGLLSDDLEAFEPDIIHSHHPFLLGDSALRMARALRLPLVFTHHTLYERYTHYVPLDSKPLRRFVISLATEYANLCTQVIAPSSSIEILLKKRGVRVPVSVLPTGIDVDHFAAGDGNRFRSNHAIAGQAMIIGHVGRLAAEKNLPYLARAMASALQQDESVHCLIAGTGDAERDIRSIFHSQGCDDRLVMTGNLTGTDLADCYAAMDVFAFASTSETQGLVLAEAMASSTPVVALKASGVDDVVRNDDNGIMLPSDADEQQFATALLSVLHDNATRQKMQKRALQTAQFFSISRCGDKLVRIYRQTIEQKTADHISDHKVFEEVLLAIQAEWELLQQKTSAAMEILSED